MKNIKLIAGMALIATVSLIIACNKEALTTKKNLGENSFIVGQGEQEKNLNHEINSSIAGWIPQGSVVTNIDEHTI